MLVASSTPLKLLQMLLTACREDSINEDNAKFLRSDQQVIDYSGVLSFSAFSLCLYFAESVILS